MGAVVALGAAFVKCPAAPVLQLHPKCAELFFEKARALSLGGEFRLCVVSLRCYLVSLCLQVNAEILFLVALVLCLIAFMLCFFALGI